MKRFYISILLLLFFVSGCASADQNIPDDTTLSTTASTTVPTTVPTTAATEPPTVPTENPNLLHVESGAFHGRFEKPGFYGSLEYYIHIPENAEKNMPLIVFLHGDGEIRKINAMKSIALVENAKTYYGENYPFIAIAPCRVTDSWCDSPNPRVLCDLIEDTAAQYEIDRDRIIITGFSSGAMGTWYMITNHTELFSAAVPISCPNEYPILYDNIKNVPIWGFVGELEDYYKRKMTEIVDKTVQLGGDARLTIVPEMPHTGMDAAAYTQEVIEWMISQ